MSGQVCSTTEIHCILTTAASRGGGTGASATELQRLCALSADLLPFGCSECGNGDKISFSSYNEGADGSAKALGLRIGDIATVYYALHPAIVTVVKVRGGVASSHLTRI